MIFGAVRHWTTTETMALLQTSKATTHGVATDVYFLARSEVTHGDGTTQLNPVEIVDAVLTEVTNKVFARFGEMTFRWFVDQLFANLAKTDLYGLIAVSF